jgi:hypothetical protein
MERINDLNLGLLYPLWIAAAVIAFAIARLARRIWRRT